MILPARVATWCLALTLVAGVSRAADEAAAPPAAAAQLFEKAMRDYDQGDLAAAIEELRAAQRAAPRPEVLYDLAQILEAAGHRAEAYRTFQEYLTTSAESVAAGRRHAVETKLNELRSQLASVEVRCTPADATVRIDRELTVPSLVDPGEHRVEVSALGFEPEAFQFQALAGDSLQLVLRLNPQAPPQFAPNTAAPRQRASAPTSAPGPARKRGWAPVLLVVGATLASGALVSELLNSSRRSDWRSQNAALDSVPASARDDTYWRARADNSARARSIRYLDGVELGLLLGAGAFAGTGLGFWFTESRSDPKTALGFTWSGRW